MSNKGAYESFNPANIVNIPPELLIGKRFVCWREEVRHGKLTKVPGNPRTGRDAKSNDPSTWGTLDEALAYYKAHSDIIKGIGRMFVEEDKMTGIDCDGCLDELGFIIPEHPAAKWLPKFNTYCEYSPSGWGVKVWVYGKHPFEGKTGRKDQKLGVEIYSHGRYFTLTGHRLKEFSAKVEPRQDEIEAFCAEYFSEGEKGCKGGERDTQTAGLDDEEIISRAMKAKNGDKFSRLWEGEWEGNYPSQSEGDCALCSMLYYQFGDRERVRRLFGKSGLGQRDKWRKRRDYQDLTLDKACRGETHMDQEWSTLVHEFQPLDSPREPRIRFFAPSELRDYQPDTDIELVGNCHITRGEVFVVGGEPGSGKSRAITGLAVAGATGVGATWLGLPVHRQFRTMIIQTENGRYRLKQEFSALDCGKLEHWIRVSEPPPFGLTLNNPEFIADIKKALNEFKPDLVILDPWNAAARDDKQSDYTDTFNALRNILPTGADKPALGIVAHTRKPQANEKRTGGTGLMHLLAGSYVLTSVPRSIFIMVRGSQDETDDSVVWFNPKNSNGENAARSAWHRTGSGFTPASDFDWADFDKPPDERKTVRLEHLAEVFDSGAKRLELNDAKHALAALVGITDGAAYNALKPEGKWADHLLREGKTITFKP